MPKVNDTNIFNFDDNISIDDYLFGTDAERNKKNKNYKIGDLITLFKKVIFEDDPDFICQFINNCNVIPTPNNPPVITSITFPNGNCCEPNIN